MDVWFKYNPSSWLFGLCVPSAKEISINKKVICTLAGPLTSFFIAAMAFYFTLALDLHGAAKLVFVILLGSSIFDLFVNLIPNATSIRLYDGSFCYNDGYQLKQLFYYKRFPKEYEVAIGLYNQKVFDKAAILFKGMLDRGINHEDVYRFAISSFFEAQNYNTAKELVEEFFTHGNITSDDYIYAGVTYINMNELEKALMHFDKSLELDNQNKYSLNNKGFVMNLLDKFEEAIPLFDKAIEVDPEFAYPYNNRGLAKIKIGKAKEGLED
ncbi:hypothetical protein, partial [Flavihumibacter sp. CACIAM 22H1]|uniref:tetratricopeptide repeat protein n=1 Tax=Flavihumibacter sp. CACIAM 22H1 TaxID=1812911 RepID=UPI0025C25FB3